MLFYWEKQKKKYVILPGSSPEIVPPTEVGEGFPV
jgi:hypothetical protein